MKIRDTLLPKAEKALLAFTLLFAGGCAGSAVEESEAALPSWTMVKVDLGEDVAPIDSGFGPAYNGVVMIRTDAGWYTYDLEQAELKSLTLHPQDGLEPLHGVKLDENEFLYMGYGEKYQLVYEREEESEVIAESDIDWIPKFAVCGDDVYFITGEGSGDRFINRLWKFSEGKGTIVDEIDCPAENGIPKAEYERYQSHNPNVYQNKISFLTMAGEDSESVRYLCEYDGTSMKKAELPEHAKFAYPFDDTYLIGMYDRNVEYSTHDIELKKFLSMCWFNIDTKKSEEIEDSMIYVTYTTLSGNTMVGSDDVQVEYEYVLQKDGNSLKRTWLRNVDAVRYIRINDTTTWLICRGDEKGMIYSLSLN